MPTDPSPSVLIVDDTPINIKVLADALGEEYYVRIATNGAKCLEIARSPSPPDIILLDIMMPSLDGFEVCRKLKADRTTARIPIIFVTAKNEMEDESEGLRLGAVDYITKPFRIPIVKARVRTHLFLMSMAA